MASRSNIGARITTADQARRFAAQVRVAAETSGKASVYFDGQTFDFRSRGRELGPEEEFMLVGVYGRGATLADINEDMTFVMSSARSKPFRKVRK